MNESYPLIKNCFPGLARSANESVRGMIRQTRTVRLPEQQHVFHVGSLCQLYLLVVEGSVCVYLTAESGRQVTLYHVRPGQSCVLTTACLLGQETYPASAYTEGPVVALAVESQVFWDTLDQSGEFRRFVFADLGRRLSDVIRRMEEVTFGDIDQRLIDLLLQHDAARLNLTHQSLATELGTAREVVSRHLKRFESRGWLQLGRGRIEILDREALLALLGGE